MVGARRLDMQPGLTVGPVADAQPNHAPGDYKSLVTSYLRLPSLIPLEKKAAYAIKKLRETDPDYSSLFLKQALRIGRKDRKAAYALLEQAPQHVLSFHPTYQESMPAIIDGISRVYLKDPKTSEILIQSMPGLLSHGMPIYSAVVDGLERLAGHGHEDPQRRTPFIKTARILCEQTLPLIKAGYANQYRSVVDGAIRLAGVHELAGKGFAEHVLALLQAKTRIPYTDVIDSLAMLAGKNVYVAEEFAAVAERILSLDEGAHYSKVVQDVAAIAPTNTRAASALGLSAYDLLCYQDGIHYPSVAKDVLELSSTGVTAREWAEKSLLVLKEENGTYYTPLFESVKLASAGSAEAGWKIANASAHIIRSVRKIGQEYIGPIIETIRTMAKSDPKSSAQFAREADELLQNAIKADPAYGPLYIDSIRKVAGKNAKAAYELAKRCPTLLKGADPNTLTPDLFLIHSIRDQKDAHVVGQVIDKTKYGKEYAKKCGGFY